MGNQQSRTLFTNEYKLCAPKCTYKINQQYDVTILAPYVRMTSKYLIREKLSLVTMAKYPTDISFDQVCSKYEIACKELNDIGFTVNRVAIRPWFSLTTVSLRNIFSESPPSWPRYCYSRKSYNILYVICSYWAITFIHGHNNLKVCMQNVPYITWSLCAILSHPIVCSPMLSYPMIVSTHFACQFRIFYVTRIMVDRFYAIYFLAVWMNLFI